MNDVEHGELHNSQTYPAVRFVTLSQDPQHLWVGYCTRPAPEGAVIQQSWYLRDVSYTCGREGAVRCRHDRSSVFRLVGPQDSHALYLEGAAGFRSSGEFVHEALIRSEGAAA
jgi:hypothetical protein